MEKDRLWPGGRPVVSVWVSQAGQEAGQALTRRHHAAATDVGGGRDSAEFNPHRSSNSAQAGLGPV